MKRQTITLIIGDILILYASLFIALTVRFGELPSTEYLGIHATPFTILIVVWLLVYFISGLYEKYSLFLKSKLPSLVFNSQLVNSFIAIIFFYFVPFFGITPKINLFIYLVVSFFLILVWRIYGDKVFYPSVKQKGILIGSGTEMHDLLYEVNHNPQYGLSFVFSIDLEKLDGIDIQREIVERIYSEEISVVAIDLKSGLVDPLLPHLYNLIFSNVKFIDMYKIYEDIFDRVPLTLVRYNWFLENISVEKRIAFDFLKRAMDFSIGTVLGLVSLLIYPIAVLIIKTDDSGPVFFTQDRVGKNNSTIHVSKFRTMSVPKFDGDEQHILAGGNFLRKFRIDELPQLWNVIVGEMSLIGPRPEIPTLVKAYEKNIPFYNIRHLIKPGLSGWAQLYHRDPPKVHQDNEKSKQKLSYDLYYIKNRSLMLDIKVALKTLKVLISRSGI